MASTTQARPGARAVRARRGHHAAGEDAGEAHDAGAELGLLARPSSRRPLSISASMAGLLDGLLDASFRRSSPWSLVLVTREAVGPAPVVGAHRTGSTLSAAAGRQLLE